MMMPKRLVFFLPLLAAGFCLASAQNRPTSPEELLKTGIGFYSEGKFAEAVTILQLAGPFPEALYWLSLAELSSGNYHGAISTLNELEKTSSSEWKTEIPYHRARCLYYIGRYEEALSAWGSYADKLADDDPRKPASYYWMGESLFALGRFDDAAEAFSLVMDKYPYSVKYEASSYRIHLITQKRVEEELLTILKWSHEESLKSIEEYQEREKNYDQAITVYQQRISELLAETGSVDAAAADAYRSQLAAAERRIAALEASLAEANAVMTGLSEREDERTRSDTERFLRLLKLRAEIDELSGILNQKLSERANEEVNGSFVIEANDEGNEGIFDSSYEEASDETNDEFIEEVIEEVNEEVNEEINGEIYEAAIEEEGIEEVDEEVSEEER